MTWTDHICSRRADLLRPFAGNFTNRSVLEIGCGGSILTRFMGECGATVTTSETFDGIQPQHQYDWIVLVEPAFPVALPFFCSAASLLGPGGALLLAIDNVPGQKELTGLLRKAGCPTQEFFFPFPDHRRPAIILREKALTEPGLDVVNLIQPYTGDARPKVAALLSNGLTGELAASIMVVAGPRDIPVPDETILGWSFNSGRKPCYNKTNLFLRTPGKGLSVKRVSHYPDTQPAGDAAVIQRLLDEPYVSGRLYSLQLSDLLSSPGWSLPDLREWAGPYFRLLQQLALPLAGRDHLNGIYVDLAPFNLLAADEDDGTLGIIDLEWTAQDPIPLEYLFFRGIYHCLARIKSARAPKQGTPVNAFGLVLGILEGFLPDTTGVLEDFVEREMHYFGPISAGEELAPQDFDLPVTLPSPETLSPAHGRSLYPLLALNLQVFIRTNSREFNEETSFKYHIGLTRERKVFTLPLHAFPSDVTHLRIDPSDHPGLLCLHTISIRGATGEELFYWTPFSRSETGLDGVIILNAAPSLPEPMTILLNADPMLIFPLPDAIRLRPAGLLLLELELSAPGETQTNTLLSTLQAIK
jgi:hypothetical protein